MEKEKILEICNALSKGNLMETLEMEFVDVGDDFLSARMPVTPRVHQLDGVLHWGSTGGFGRDRGQRCGFGIE